MRLLALLPLLGACSMAGLGTSTPRPDGSDVVVVVNPGEDVLRPRARPDGTAGEGELPQTGEAPPEPQSNGYLGETLAGLGAPGETGLWLTTGLVAVTQPGRIETETGQSLDVELRASGAAPSAGSQISLQAMQALGLPFAGLSTLKVYTD